MKTPGFVIAGTNSGCGKTTLSMGLMAILRDRGLKVQPFKVGPDYIDPMFHTFITGKPSRNLDSWMLSSETVKHLYHTHAREADIAVTEGVMGFYDGYGGTSLEGSTAHVAQLIGAPVVLVVNAEAMSLSAAALVKGFMEFVENPGIRGVILNRVSSQGHYDLLKQAIENHTGAVVLGYVKKMEDAVLESRHLGLVTSDEIKDLAEKVDRMSREMAQTLDVERLLELAGEAADHASPAVTLPEPIEGSVRIGVARDKAFCFYYQDNLDLLTALGAELIPFSPLGDTALPQNLDGLYLGGGYPEVWGQALGENQAMKKAVKHLVEKGCPVYAECGGMMYLIEGIETLQGEIYPMVGVIPGRSFMTNSLKRFGYVTLRTTADNCLTVAGEEIRGHEFHYSHADVPDGVTTCYQVSKSRDDKITRQWQCGYQVHQVLAGYPHIHFWSNPAFAKGFVSSCRDFRKAEGK